MQAEVTAGLDKDVRLAVLQKVLPDTPVHSCLYRMVITKKWTGQVRRTVDMRPLNRACPRQTHAVEPPFLQASGVPAKSWKTCLDAKEDYHSIPIYKDNQKQIAFLTRGAGTGTW